VKIRIMAFHFRNVGMSSMLASSYRVRSRGSSVSCFPTSSMRTKLTPSVCQTDGKGLAIKCKIDTPRSKNCTRVVRFSFNRSLPVADPRSEAPASTHRSMIIIDRARPSYSLEPLPLRWQSLSIHRSEPLFHVGQMFMQPARPGGIARNARIGCAKEIEQN